MHCAIVLILICICHQVIANKNVAIPVIHDRCCKLTNYNVTQADLGEAFFRQLIFDDDSFKHVNEQNMCSLIHFFIREAFHNGESIEFSSGTFVLYDSTERFFAQLMMAKSAQNHSNEHRSGYIRRLRHFLFDSVKATFRILSRRKSSVQLPFIYLRGDESSHFHERGNKHDRWNLYPAYGMDTTYGCMPNKFSHILFGQLQSLSNNVTHLYRGDRIYIKPEQYGLQQFSHYLGHSSHYIRAVLHLFVCRFVDRITPNFCIPKGVFHEWTDRRLVKKWTQILKTIDTLTESERRNMQQQAFSHGILEIYRQTLLFPLVSQVNDFRVELESRYGHDVSSRKGHEIIFTTEQLLHSSPTTVQSFLGVNQQCETTCTNNSLL